MSGGWNTIESDAGVFTFLIESLGCSNIQFEELVSLDPETLQQLNPIGVIFLFKYPTNSPPTRDAPLDGEYDYAALEYDNPSSNSTDIADDDEELRYPVWFAAQTIQNACGTQALLSILLNQPPFPSSSTSSSTAPQADSGEKTPMNIGPHLLSFRDFTLPLPPSIRGEALSNSTQIRDAHNSFARSSPFVSDESREAGDDDDVYHFIAYTSIHSTLYELDGLQPAPIRHGDVGACPREIFGDAVVPVLQRRIERYPATEIRFNLLAVCEDLRVRARESGDGEALEREERKRREWRWENALRRHNLVGFVGELLKGVVEAKVREGGFEAWVEEGKGRTEERVRERKKLGRAGGAGGVEGMDLS